MSQTEMLPNDYLIAQGLVFRAEVAYTGIAAAGVAYTGITTIANSFDFRRALKGTWEKVLGSV